MFHSLSQLLKMLSLLIEEILICRPHLTGKTLVQTCGVKSHVSNLLRLLEDAFGQCISKVQDHCHGDGQYTHAQGCGHRPAEDAGTVVGAVSLAAKGVLCTAEALHATSKLNLRTTP